MRVPGRSVRKVNDLVIITISRAEWQAFLAEYDSEDPACHDTTLRIFYADLCRYARTTTPVEAETWTDFENVYGVVLHKRWRLVKGYEVIFDRDGSSWAIKTIEDMPVVRVG